MRWFFLFLFAGTLMLTACSPVTGIEVSKAWTRPAAQGETGVVYFLLENHSASPEELTGLSSSVAEIVEMHQTSMDGDIMRMRQVNSMVIEGNGQVEFAPGGYHVMLVQTKHDLNVGEEIQVTFHFRNHEDMTVNIPVLEQNDGFMNSH